MQIILKEDIANLGFADELVKVKAGYARNYLIPKGIAILASKPVLKAHEEKLKQRARKEGKIKEQAESTAKALETASIIVLTKAGEKGRIFGAINTIQVAESIEKLGHQVDRKFIKIRGEAIKGKH